MARLWMKIIKNHKITAQQTVACSWGDEKAALGEICKALDLACPIWLSKHESEYSAFRRTAFNPEHFMEDVAFDRMEIEFLDDTGKRSKSSDPRNQF